MIHYIILRVSAQHRNPRDSATGFFKVQLDAALDAARTLGRPVDIASWRHAEQLPALFNGMPMGTRILA